MAYCKSCGAGLDEGESTCRYCGTKQVQIIIKKVIPVTVIPIL